MPDETKRQQRRSKGAAKKKLTTETLKCPEGDYEARLILEWDAEGNWVLKGISCDNPRFAGLDNWDCTWSCWDKIKASKKK